MFYKFVTKNCLSLQSLNENLQNCLEFVVAMFAGLVASSRKYWFGSSRRLSQGSRFRVSKAVIVK